MPLSPIARSVLLAALAAMPAGLCAAPPTPAAQAAAAAPDRQQLMATMKRATRFMVETVSTRGGYVWSYLPDLSRRWGELEATPSMIWVQPPGTPDMGQLFLDAYHATGDEYYYDAAAKAADALIAGEVPTGGWNYFADFAGPAATRAWYDTVGRNAWRMEEFQHYWGNATFDDNGTAGAMKFILRLYAERLDPRYKAAVERHVRFVLDSQYPAGGWPQRFPLRHEFVHHGQPDYTSYVTFNDDVTAENVDYLIQAQRVLGDERVGSAIKRGMDVYLLTQGGDPQPGWALQYTPDDLQPAGARSYEPRALATHATGSAIGKLLDFYELTGDTRYLARVPAALAWLRSVKLPAAQVRNGREYPTFVELGTNRALYVHRRGSNVVNGEYYVDHSPDKPLEHYSPARAVDAAALAARYDRLKALDPAAVRARSPLFDGRPHPLPRYAVVDLGSTSDRNVGPADRDAARVVAGLNAQGWWPSQLKVTSHPYAGPGSARPAPGDFASTRVGDATDTSPFIDPRPVTGISTGLYIENMATLIAALDAGGPAR